jgi:hypothetical protein
MADAAALFDVSTTTIRDLLRLNRIVTLAIEHSPTGRGITANGIKRLRELLPPPPKPARPSMAAAHGNARAARNGNGKR